jgi:hypothetical protein
MPEAGRSGPHPRRDAPAWPPYVARIDDEDDVIALDASPALVETRMSVVTWQPPPTVNREWTQARPAVPPRQEPPPLRRDRPRGPDARVPSDSFQSSAAEGEVLFANLDPAARRAISQQPIIALTVNALGYHIFISHAARRLLSRLVLIGLGVLLALFWGDLTAVAEFLRGFFAH